jgi:uncharacterized protein
MLTLDLPRLEREGFLDLEAEIAPDSPLWEGTGLRFAEPVAVKGRATLAGSGEVLFQGTVESVAEQECRRCLAPVRTPVALDALLVFGAPDEEAGEDGEIHPVDPDAVELSLGPAIREELILAVDPYVLCDPECRGLCPRCGVDRNKETCECTLEEADPRWDALRALKSE